MSLGGRNNGPTHKRMIDRQATAWLIAHGASAAGWREIEALRIMHIDGPCPRCPEGMPVSAA